MIKALLPAALALWLATGCGPVPGGSLGGTTAQPPGDWSTALEGDRAFCEIESRPADPHSIQLECFELRAVHVTEPALRESVLRFRGYDPVPAGIALFRLDPRASQS
jgi:hypothetical protein